MFDLMIFIVVMIMITIFILSILILLLNYVPTKYKIVINSVCLSICVLLFTANFIIGTLIALSFKMKGEC